MKKLLFLFALSLCSLAAWAYSFSAVAPSGQILYYNISGGSVSVTYPGSSGGFSSYSGYNKPSGALAIPSSVTYSDVTYSVTSIGNYAFYGCSDLTSVTIPNSVTNIGNNAFSSCGGLVNIIIPDSVSNIGSSAFSNCSSLTSVSIPDLVTSIESNTFYNCSSLSNITIPNTVTSIGNSAFNGCSGLSCVIIGESVTSIGDYAFDLCSNVDTLYYKAKNLITSNKWYSSFSGYGFRPMTNLKVLIISNGVKKIPSGAFYNQNHITSVTIPTSVTRIGYNAFYGCSNVDTLFFNASNLTTESYWYDNGTLGNSYGFRSMTNLSVLKIGDSVQNIPTAAFYKQTHLTNVNIPNSVTKIDAYAFLGCSNLTTIDIANSVTRIGSWAFSNCTTLTNVIIPNSVTYISDCAFEHCSSLTSVRIPNSVTYIGCDAFYNCTNLASVTIGSSVSSIGDYAFDYCSNLKTVYNLSNLTITKGATTNGKVAYNAKRVINPTDYGTGNNTIHQIPTSYSFVNTEDNVELHIPRSTIPSTNFIYKDGSSWKAKEIILTDDTSRFEAPVAFTAVTATYTREFTNSNRSTLYLPFTAAIPENFEVYDFTNFANNTISFTEHTGDIAAYTPYLVGYDLSKDPTTTTCTITKTNAVFPKSSTATPKYITHNNMTFQGVLERTQMTNTNNYGYSNGFFVQSGGAAHANPFRCYFTYTPSGDAPQNLPPTLNMDFGDPVGIDAVETPEEAYDGRYGKDVYDMLGRLVRKNAESLEGLPRGIYIWKGKKAYKN